MSGWVYGALGLAAFACLLAPAVEACGKGPLMVTGAVDVTVCVLEHATDTPEQIAAECAGVAVADVIKILAAHKAAMLRERAADSGAVGK